MHLQNNKKTFKIPSKTFLFGEYAVLSGAPAFVLAHEPFFDVDNNLQDVNVHEKSPAGLLLNHYEKEKLVSLKDPHNKRGGFGRSTAEFVSALSLLDEELSIEDVYEKYISGFSHKVKPSGADLITQLLNSSIVFSNKPLSYKKIIWPFQDISILICHTNNKVETHDHLNQDLSLVDFSNLRSISENLKKAIESINFDDFLSLLKAYSTELKSLGLIHENTAKVTSFLNMREDVLFSRGCGALGADVVLILTNKNLDTSDLSSSFKQLNLNLVCRL